MYNISLYRPFKFVWFIYSKFYSNVILCDKTNIDNIDKTNTYRLVSVNMEINIRNKTVKMIFALQFSPRNVFCTIKIFNHWVFFFGVCTFPSKWTSFLPWKQTLLSSLSKNYSAFLVIVWRLEISTCIFILLSPSRAHDIYSFTYQFYTCGSVIHREYQNRYLLNSSLSFNA